MVALIVLDASALIAYLGGLPEAAEVLSAHAGEPWMSSPLALAEVLAPAVAESSECLARVQHVIVELQLVEVDLTSHAGVILGRLLGESGLPLAAVGTLQLALERDAPVVSFDAELRAACEMRGLTVLPGGRLTGGNQPASQIVEGSSN